MNFLETYGLAISTLSPVHVGCGEDYEPTHYVIDGETLYAFDPAQLLAELTAAQRDELTRALDGRDPMLATQRFFFRHKDKAKTIARHTAPVAPAAARFYASRIGQLANRESDGGKVINKLEIARTAFNLMSGLPILPGSSLKGAIRTAVLETLRQDRHQRFPLSDQDAARFATASRAANDMERRLMGGGFQDDPMRLVKVGDAEFQPGSYKARNSKGEEISLERKARSVLFQVNRKKRPNQFESRASIETLVECVPAGQPRAFHASLNIERKARQGQGTPSLQPDWAMLTKACNAFYLARLEEELEIIENNRFASEAWLKNARGRLAAGGIWGKAMAEGRGFLLRVGRHSGAESVTVDAPRKIKILGAKGQPPSWKDHATTLWLAANEPGKATDMWPFGWVFVQIR
jgi:CRISPR-associated protein Csm5